MKKATAVDNVKSKETEKRLVINKSEYKKLHGLKQENKINTFKDIFRTQQIEASKKPENYPFTDFYSNTSRNSEVPDSEIPIIKRSESISSVQNIATELSYFTMEKKKKNGIKSMLTIFSNKKSPPVKTTGNDEDFDRKSFKYQSAGSLKSPRASDNVDKKNISKEDELKYAKIHVQKFNKMKDKFENNTNDENTNSTQNKKSFMLEDIKNTLQNERLGKNEDIKNQDNKKTDLVKKRLQYDAQKRPVLDEVYGTVHDSIPTSDKEKRRPQSTVISSPKLKIPSNRKMVQLIPKSPVRIDRRSMVVKSPSPSDKPSKDKQNNYTTNVAKPNDLQFRYDDVSIARKQRTLNKSEYEVHNTDSPVLRHRNRSVDSDKSVDKNNMRRSVEAFYWRELKKMEDQKQLEYEEYQQRIYGYLNQAAIRRSHSLSPTMARNQRMSLNSSKPFNNIEVNNENYPSQYGNFQNEPIYEDRRLIVNPEHTLRRGSLIGSRDKPQYYQRGTFSRASNYSGQSSMLTSIPDDDVFYSDTEYKSSHRRSLIAKNNPALPQRSYTPNNFIVVQTTRRHNLDSRRTSQASVYDNPKNYEEVEYIYRDTYAPAHVPNNRYSYAPPPTRQYVLPRDSIYSTGQQINPNFIRNSRITSSTGNIQQLSRNAIQSSMYALPEPKTYDRYGSRPIMF